MMRTINVQDIADIIKELCINANLYLNDDILTALKEGFRKENHPIAKDILNIIIENAELAADKEKPLCQDTGIGLFFIEIGQEVSIRGGNLTSTVHNAMSQVYTSQPYRFSVVTDPLFGRQNSNTNLPPIIHWEIVSGDKVSITFMPKGGGAENMSRIKMFNPLSSYDEIKDFVIDTVRTAGGKPCPPIVIGVGIGGNFDYAALLAKKALLRPLNIKNEDKKWADFEDELLEDINRLGIGPMGLGGMTTALGVNVLTHPCHIASLPVAVNLQCHSHRYKSVTI